MDLEKSTENILYCYDYMIMDVQDRTQELVLEIYQNQDVDMDVVVDADTVLVPLQEEITKKEYVNVDGGNISLSPIAMNVEVRMGTLCLSLTAWWILRKWDRLS